MANAARVHAIESGKTYAGRTLIAFGGGGPVHACRVAEKVGINRVLVPSGAGVGSAIGFLRAPVGYEVVRSLYQRFSTFDVAAVNDLLDDMRQEAEAAVAKGSFGAPVTETRTAYMRYVGQGHEIPVPLPNDAIGSEDIASIRARYDREYANFFDRPVPGSDVEIMSYAVVVTTATDDVTPPVREDSLFTLEATPVRTQRVRDTQQATFRHGRSTTAPHSPLDPHRRPSHYRRRRDVHTCRAGLGRDDQRFRIHRDDLLNWIDPASCAKILRRAGFPRACNFEQD